MDPSHTGSMIFKQKDLRGFSKAAHSLKLYRRAELRDDETDQTLIERLYVDPLQNDGVLGSGPNNRIPKGIGM